MVNVKESAAKKLLRSILLWIVRRTLGPECSVPPNFWRGK